MNSEWFYRLPQLSTQQLAVLVIRGLCVYLLLYIAQASAAENLTDEIERLNDEFQALSLEFYSHRTSDRYLKGNKLQDMDDLKKIVMHLAHDDKPQEAIKQLYLHTELIEKNLQHTAVADFLALLLDHNELNLSQRLLDKITREADDFQIARARFIFARYHAEQLQWKKVKQLLENVTGELSADEAAYASLLHGTALQQLRQHREAQQSYEKITTTSPYYRHARLNLAIAQIRQGWLTSARKTINDLLATSEQGDADDFSNRLYLVLGYALLQKDYYRSAREVFRKISLDSAYLNRALLGIALCVINMGEFEHGLNTLALLKAKKSTELTVDESYLLIPYVYEKLQQEVDVATTYTEAMTHFQNRIEQLKKIQQQYIQLAQVEFAENMKTIRIGEFDFEYANQFPKKFFQNYQQLIRFSSTSRNSPFTATMETLLRDYGGVFKQVIDTLVQQRIEHINSYLSQARYGLAELYDKSQQEQR